MRAAVKKSSGRKFSARSLGHRWIPAALASIGFLVTFSVRSWQQGLWHSGQAADYATVSAIQQAAHARTAAAPPESARPLESVLGQEAARLRALPMPTAPSAVASADAQHYLAERDREESHDGRLR
jgi:hypothetical protein